MTDLGLVRAQLHSAVDRVLDDFLNDVVTLDTGGADGIEVVARDATADWTYRWPGGDTEDFFETRWYDADGPRGPQRVRVAWAHRPAWGRADRKRAIVFNQLGTSESTAYYPWTEFVEADDGRYAAPIPDPDRPRAMISDPERVPQRFAGRVVARSDELFRSVNDGPSLRLVVPASDEVAMVEHGYWVAVLRRRI